MNYDSRESGLGYTYIRKVSPGLLLRSKYEYSVHYRYEYFEVPCTYEVVKYIVLRSTSTSSTVTYVEVPVTRNPSTGTVLVPVAQVIVTRTTYPVVVLCCSTVPYTRSTGTSYVLLEYWRVRENHLTIPVLKKC
jgi:hypothetical protein